MPSADSKKTSGSQFIRILLTLSVLGIIAVLSYEWVTSHQQKDSQKSVATNHVIVQQRVPAVVAMTNSGPAPAAPGTPISAESVLAKVDKWVAEHPNYHVAAVTAFPNGTIMGKMDVFAYTNATAGKVTALSAQLFLPQAIGFVGVKKDGKFLVYFPDTDQLVQQDLNQAMAAVPALAGASGFKALLKVAKNSYAEASADLEVATLVLNSQTLKLGDLPSTDIYLSIRSNNQGQLLGLDQQTGAGHIMTTMQYVSFDLPTIAHEAPMLPAGKTVVTNKTVQQALQDEMRLVSRKPLGKKI
ncbi:MAG TPA: hypothetical protein VFB72_17900 [Verrucomicrobiae bacterium]|nr:hypothetical protein [Verrucomicrobiae bacterium]